MNTFLQLCVRCWSFKDPVMGDGKEVWDQRRNLEKLFVNVCLYLCCVLSAFMCMTCPEEVFSQGKYRAAGVSLFMCVRVWSPLNDYYGLTPISRIELLRPRFFQSPGNGKENIFPSVAYYWDLVLCSHTQNHTKPPAHMCSRTHWGHVTSQYLGLHGPSHGQGLQGESLVGMWQRLILMKATDTLKHTYVHIACCEVPQTPTTGL